jgi:transposase
MSNRLIIQAQHKKDKFTCPLCGGIYDPVPEYGPFWNGKLVCLECGFEKDRDLKAMLDAWLWNCQQNP